MLLEAVVVARDGAGTDVAVRTDLAVAEIGQVVCLGPGADHRLLGLDEVADVHALREPRAFAQARERSDDRVRADLRLLDPAAQEEMHPVTERRIDEPRGAVEPPA